MEKLAQDVRLAVRRLGKTPGLHAGGPRHPGPRDRGQHRPLQRRARGPAASPCPSRSPTGSTGSGRATPRPTAIPSSCPSSATTATRTRPCEALAGFANWSGNLTGDGRGGAAARPARVGGTSSTCWARRPALGRTLRPADDTPGHEKVVVLSHGLWQRRFGGDPAVVGRSLTLNGESFTVVGVLEPGLPLPRPRHRPRHPPRPGPGPLAAEPRVHELHPGDRAGPGGGHGRPDRTATSTPSPSASRRSSPGATRARRASWPCPTARS